MADINNLRNIALIGHGGEGKTTLCESILYQVKATDRMGKVTDGNTVMDFDPEEIARKSSISLSLANIVWENTKINIIDVPGFFDFEGELIQANRVADSFLVVTAPNTALSVGCEKALDMCVRNKKPAMVFINQMDKENANFIAAINALKGRYGTKIAPVLIPIMDGQKMTGYISLISDKSYKFDEKGRIEIPMPEALKKDFNDLKDGLIESAAANDDALMEKFFEGEQLTQQEIVSGLSIGIRNGDVIPVLAGSALYSRGVINLLNQIVRLLPSPEGIQFGAEEDGKRVRIACGSAGATCCQVFKTISDPFVGKLSLFKVIRGAVKSGSSLYNVNADKQEKIAGLYFSKGKKQESTDTITAGDIGAFSKLQFTRTGDTLTEGVKIQFDEIVFPEPVYAMAITSAKQGDEDKVFGGLARLMEEDNTIRVYKNSDTVETLIRGLGETHVDVIIKKLKSKFGVEALLSSPKIPYKETIRKVATAQGKHKKQSGGHGQYGDCHIRFEPYPDGTFLFEEEVVGGSVPRNFIPAVEKGLLECIPRGVLAGYPVVNLKAVLYDGSYHDVDSSEMAFKLAASIAFKKGCMEASPTMLEPIYSYKIYVPDSYLGDIMGDMSKRRGRILGTAQEDGRQVISAEAPYAEMFRYATDLRSMTQGRGSFVCQLERYEEVPANLIPGIVAASPFKRAATED